MFVADAHCDTLYSIAVQNMDPEKCMITPERLVQGGVGLQTFAMFAGSRRFKEINATKQGGFSAARRADYAGYVAFLDIEIDVFEHLVSAEDFAEMAHFDD